MRVLPQSNRLFHVQWILAAVLTGTVLVVHLSPLDQVRSRVRSQFVTTGLLDYGEKGKIIKSLGLVYGIREEDADFTPYTPGTGRTTPFRKKRERGEYRYRANPGSGYRLPSTLAVGEGDFRDGWRLASVVIDEAEMDDPVSGIAANPYPRGRSWERRATFSVFDGDRLAVAANVGVRIHGSDRERALAGNGLDHSYRIYFRNFYGADSVPANLVFTPASGSVKRLVFKNSRPIVDDLALDVAAGMGALVPRHTPAILYLNGGRLGVYSLQEHVGRRQWELRLGHQDFYFVRRGGTVDEEAVAGYGALSEWLRENPASVNMEAASKRVDLRNLTRNLFQLMFCGANDRFEEAAVLDYSEAEPRWRWITWNLTDCFTERWPPPGGGPAWHQPAVQQIVARDRQSRAWSATYRSLRSDLFAVLLNNSAAYVAYFLRTATDVLNHEITPEFIRRRIGHYQRLLENHPDPLDADRVAALRSAQQYLEHRPEFVRGDLTRAFGLAGVHQVEVIVPAEQAYIVDGYDRIGSFSGRYFTDQVAEVRLPDQGGAAAARWRVNGELAPGSSVRIPVESDTVVKLERAQ